MNIYDYAHGLVKAIKNSSEYKQFKEDLDRLEKDPGAKEMLHDFRKNQWELEKQKLSGVDISPELEEKKPLRQSFKVNYLAGNPGIFFLGKYL